MKPNFFIVGAPKCGTTALSEYLREHPNVFMATPKEPGYFSEDLPGLQFIRKREQYEQLFQAARPDRHLAVGEASPSYLFSKVAIERIRACNPDARLIVMLRNPLDLLPSYHAQLLFSLFEEERDFVRAWGLQQERAQGRMIPDACREPALLQYGAVVRFAEQLQRLFAVFPREQVLVLLFEDFRSHTKETYERVLSFLDLPADGREVFPVINPAKEARWNWINQCLHLPPEYLVRKMRLLAGTRLFRWLVQSHGALKNLNLRERPPSRLSAETRGMLLQELRPDMEALEALLQADLSHWFVADAASAKASDADSAAMK